MTDVWDRKRIRTIRRALRLTQSELGKLLGLSGATVSRWENGYAPSSHQQKGLERLEAELSRARAEHVAQIHNFSEECITKAPSGSIPHGVMREVYNNWCDEKGLMPASWGTLEEALKELGLKSEDIPRPGQIFPRHVWAGVTFKAGLHRNSHSPRNEFKSPPETPPAGPGPQYSAKGGKLASVPHPPDDDEVAQQVRLHALLRSKIENLIGALGHAGNQYSELIRAADEYAQLLGEPTHKLDIVAIWSVGGALHDLSGAYRQQQVETTLAPPLEPQMAAALSSVIRDHGAFVMGFKEGRELVERADRFLLQQRELIQAIEGPGQDLLEELVTNEELVDEETRKIHGAINDALQVAGWEAGRTTYTAYLTVRNAFRVIIKISVGVLGAAGLAVTASTLAGDPNCDFIRVAIPVLQHYAGQLLAFFNHSPDFRAYVEWALHILERDRNGRN